MSPPAVKVNTNLLVLSFLVFSDIKIQVEYLNKLKYECCQNSKPEKSIVYVDTDKENCERYRQNDRENQQYNRTFQLVHTNYDLSVIICNCKNTNLLIMATTILSFSSKSAGGRRPSGASPLPRPSCFQPQIATTR